MIVTAYNSWVEMVVPSTVKVSRPADTTKWVDRVVQDFTAWFGGTDIRRAEGSYFSEQSGIVIEESTHVLSYCEDAVLKQQIGAVFALACEMCEALSQEAVALVVNGRMYYVSPGAA